MIIRYFKDGKMASNNSYTRADFTKKGVLLVCTEYECDSNGNRDYDKPLTVQELIQTDDLISIEW